MAKLWVQLWHDDGIRDTGNDETVGTAVGRASPGTLVMRRLRAWLWHGDVTKDIASGELGDRRRHWDISEGESVHSCDAET